MKVTILGFGTVGTWIKTLIPEDFAVTTVDLVDADLISDVLNPCINVKKQISDTDYLILALPEITVLHCLRIVSLYLSKRTVVISTTSVQENIFKESVELNIESQIFGLNPMFNPRLQTGGNSVVLVAAKNHSCEAKANILKWLKNSDLDPVFLSPKEHDQAMVNLQVLPHLMAIASAKIIGESNLDISLLYKIAPPPSKLLFSISARILKLDPHVYFEIQSAGSGVTLRNEVIKSIKDLEEILEFGSEDFCVYLEEIARNFSPILEEAAVNAENIYNLLGKMKNNED